MVKDLKELMRKFNTEELCREFMVQQRWGGKPVCPYCGCDKSYKIEKGKRFKCANSECYKKYSVTVGTVYEATNIPLTTWFPAMYLIMNHKKGISSLQLSRDLGVTQKTAWFMLHRIREQLKMDNSPLLDNIVEIDETYAGGKVKNMSNKKRASLRTEAGGTQPNKIMVMGMLERGGQLKLIVGGKSDVTTNIQPIVRENVDKDAVLITDGHGAYQDLGKEYAGHEVVNHKGDEYVRDGVIHTNGIEGAFSMLKRSIIGIYHNVSPKHLHRYCTETGFRYNSRKLLDGDRFAKSLTNMEGRLTYKELIKKTELSADLLVAPVLPPLAVTDNRYRRPILQIQNGKVIAHFSSIKEASIITGIKQQMISKVVRGFKRSTGGYEWKYA